MSIHRSVSVWNFSQQEGNHLLAMLALADNAGDDGYCWPSLPYIASKIRCSPRTAIRLVQKLEEDGELYVKHGEGRGNPNRYIVLPGLEEKEIARVLVQKFDLPRKEADPLARALYAKAPKQKRVTVSPNASSAKRDKSAENVTTEHVKCDTTMSPESSVNEPSLESSSFGANAAPPPRFRVGDVVRDVYTHQWGRVESIYWQEGSDPEEPTTLGWWYEIDGVGDAHEVDLSSVDEQETLGNVDIGFAPVEEVDYLPEWASEFDKATPKAAPVKAEAVKTPPPLALAPPSSAPKRADPATPLLKAYTEAVTGKGLYTKRPTKREGGFKPITDELIALNVTEQEVRDAVERATTNWPPTSYYHLDKLPDAIRALRAVRAPKQQRQSEFVPGSGILTRTSARMR